LAGLSFAIYGAIDSIQFFTQSDYREIPIEMALLDKTLAAAPKGGLVALTEDYGTSLRFYASRKARHWPHLGDLNYFELQGSSPQDLEELWQTTSGASYFFVSDQKELARQPLLAEKLIQLPILLQTEHFTLYQLIP
jgi:hypothetical protein